MYNEATYHTGLNTANPATKAEATLRQDCRVCAMDETPERCTGSKQGQAQSSTTRTTADALLRNTFLPLVVEETKKIKTDSKEQKTERDIYLSLSKLSKHFGIELLPTQQYGYPYNISLAMWDANKRLKEILRSYESIELIQEQGETFVQCTQRYSLEAYTYYFIPVLPLYKLLHCKKRKKAAVLLLSVYSYLYHCADIPYYGHPVSFLNDEYEMIKEWVEYEFDEGKEDYLREFYVAELAGDYIGQRISNANNLTFFAERLANFKPNDDFEREVYAIAAESLSLYQTYPDQSIFRNAEGYQISEEEQLTYFEEYGHLPMHKLISFVAATEGILYEALSSGLNSEFQEYVKYEEPLLKIIFKEQPSQNLNLDFEHRLFALMEDLTDTLV